MFKEGGGQLNNIETTKSKEEEIDIDEVIDRFKEEQLSKDSNNAWIEGYGENPASFFDKQNIKNLKQLSPEKRLVLLANASGYLTNTPEMAKQYFQEFPKDLEVIARIFFNNNGRAENAGEFFLFSISAEEMHNINPNLKDQFYSLEHYLERADRKKDAPRLLLNNFGLEYNDNFKKFGQAAKGIKQALQEAEELANGFSDHFIDPEQIFTPEYEALAELDKAEFLRICMAEIQYYLVHNEVMNSVFTKERVQNDEKTTKDRIKKYGKGYYNVAHSMVYKTYQPSMAYNEAQDNFSHTMDNTATRGGMIEEYPFHRLLLAVLDKIKNLQEEQDKNTDVLVDFWHKNRNPIFANGVASALSEQNVNKAATELLSLLRAEKDDKTPLSAMLYRLEFGKIGISEDGVKYLEKIYDLEDFNNPNYHASRLTNEGEIGIFNNEQELIKYFHLGNLNSEDKKVKAEVMDFVYQTLFVGKTDETPEEKQQRMNYLEEFKKNYFQISQDEIFQNTGVKLNNLSFLEQGWFIIYFNEANEHEKNRLRDFVRNYGEEGIKVFLSLEQGQNMGNTILDIGESLDNFPKAAKTLFLEFSHLAYNTEQISQKFVQMYNNMFYEKKFDKDKMQELILSQANNLLMEASHALKEAPEDKKEKVIKDLINNLIKQKFFREQSISEFEKIAEDINSIYDKIYKLERDMEEKEWEEIIESSIEDLSEEEKKEIIEEKEKTRKYDSDRIKLIIKNFEDKYNRQRLKFFSVGNEINWDNGEPKDNQTEKKEIHLQSINGQWQSDDEMKIINEKKDEAFEKSNEEAKKIWKPLVDKYKKLLPFQIDFERKLERIIFGHESAVLPKELLQSLPQEVDKLKLEQMPKREPVYFPVGISKDLPAWQKTQEGKMQAAKPMELYGYLFWLNNQNKKIQLVVCDEIQVSNYQNLYGLDEKKAKEEAKKIGKIEAKNYQNIIDEFGLNNITIVSYEKFLDDSGREKIKNYKKLCNDLYKNPLFANAFLDMVQESIGENKSKEEKEKYLPYAMEELAFILARDGTKISHINEARYDVLASVIKNIENYAQQNNKNINELSEDEFKQVLVGVMQSLNDFINKFKDKEEKGSPKFSYFDKVGKFLRKIRIPAQTRPPKDFNKKSIKFNFIAPNVGSASFGWRSAGEKKETEAVMKFKEPYSTYFYANPMEMFLNSDQVIAAPGGDISGKIMALDNEKQEEYIKEVDLPILVNFFKVLEKTPDEYFEKIDKNKEEIMLECQLCETLTDLHRFMQKYIVTHSMNNE